MSASTLLIDGCWEQDQCGEPSTTRSQLTPQNQTEQEAASATIQSVQKKCMPEDMLAESMAPNDN
jgi:hypothetical protein